MIPQAQGIFDHAATGSCTRDLWQPFNLICQVMEFEMPEYRFIAF